jgi:hypothetical protein
MVTGKGYESPRVSAMSVSDIANPAQPVAHRDKLQWRFNIPSLGRITRSDADPLSDISVCNREFISQIRHLRMLKRFMLEEKMSFSETDIETMNLGHLNNLRYRVHGRLVTMDEWAALDKLSSAITSHLDTLDLKRKIRIRELGLFFGKLPLIFLCLAVISTGVYLIFPPSVYKIDLIAIVYSLAQGGLGACAFLGTSVVRKSAEDIDRIQNAPEQGSKNNEISQQLADITDRNFLKIRIILGMLFGFLLGLPLAHAALHTIWTSVTFFQNSPDQHTVMPVGTVIPVGLSAEGIALMVMPFLIGFSTNLVLVLFSRFISIIQTLFGIPTRT